MSVRQQLLCVQKVAVQTFDLPASGKHLPVVHWDVVAIQILRSYFSFLRADSFLIPAALPNLSRAWLHTVESGNRT